MTETVQLFRDALEMGGPWLAVAALLCVVIWRIFKLLMESQEKRIEEGNKTIEAITENTNALKSLTEYVKDRRD